MINIPIMEKSEVMTPEHFKMIVGDAVSKFVLCNQEELDKRGSLILTTFCVVNGKIYRAKLRIGVAEEDMVNYYAE